MTRDLLHSAEIRELVRTAYRERGVNGSGGAVASRLYAPEELDGVPQSAIDGALGVANHMRHAQIRRGDTVLDVGCGAGIDAIIAAARTGREGRVIALDVLPEMLERTAAAAEEAGVANVEPLLGEMEAIPLPDASVDYIVSNGVINLSARKRRVFLEFFRVLRPGGGLCFADLTADEDELPPEILTHPATWAG